jgi:hypothetical protein
VPRHASTSYPRPRQTEGVQELGIVVGVFIAAGGWIANGVLARRAVRRDKRVDYLMSAYRRLDAASNRPLTPELERELESAVSDIQLLGTQQQIDLADAFARSIAVDRSATTMELLEALRAHLRHELLLPAARPRSVWLRFFSTDEWVQEVAFVRARVAVGAVTAARRAAPAHSENASVDPRGAVLSRYEEFDRDMHALLASDDPLRPVPDLVSEAVAVGRVSQETGESIQGLVVLRNLAATSSREMSADDVEDYSALVEGVTYAVRSDLRRNAT